MPSLPVTVPNIGDAHDVNVVEVLVQLGARIEPEQPLIVLESDKASMEIPSPFGGVVQSLAVSVGDKVSEGALILTVDAENGPAVSAAVPAPAPVLGPESIEAPAGSAAPAVLPALEPVEPPAGPAVRRLARELGVELVQVPGSGRAGRITKEDVGRHAERSAPAASNGVRDSHVDPAESSEIDFTRFGEVSTQPLTQIQKASGRNLHRSWTTIPHVTQFAEADITDLEAFRQKVQASQQVKLTPLAFFIKGLCVALRSMPRFNASLDARGENLIFKKYFHIGVAVDTPNGLVVPVIRNANAKGVREIARELADVSERARTRRLTPNDLHGASMTISSLGGIGGTAFTPIINPPEVAVLGISRATLRPVCVDGAVVLRLMCPLSLSYDHRVIDGADAARFATLLCEIYGDILQMLL